MSATDAAYEAAEDYDAYEDDEEEALPGLFILLMGVLIVAAFGAVVWMAYQQGVRSGRGETGVPYVQAEPGPIKIETARDSEPARRIAAFDAIDPDADPVEPEVLLSSAEEPLLDSGADDAAADENVDDEITVADAGETGASIDEVARRIVEEQEAASAPVTNPEPQTSRPATRPQTVSTEPAATESQPAASAAPAAIDALSGDYVVQVASFPSEREARRGFEGLEGNFPTLLEGLAADIQSADLGDRGTWHRLRVGPFEGKADADAFCASLKERGRDCLVKRS